MIRARTRRGGFTLIELLVVIGIIALLAAIGVGTYFRMMGSSEERATETTITKLTAPLQRQWAAARDTAEQEWRNNTNGCQDALLTYCGSDRDRGKSLWMYLRLKNEFPQTFAEAKADTVLEYPVNSGTYILTIPKKKLFANLPAAGATKVEEAAVLLRMFLERGGRGETYGDEATGALGGDVTIGGNKYPVFKDLFGQPLYFVRTATNAEINGTGFTKPGATSQDPLDTKGKLLAANWTDTARRQAAANAVFGKPSSGSNDFQNTNWVMTIVSGGPDKVYATDLANVATNSLIQVDDTKDDILGYKFRREGQQGRGPQ